MRITALNNQTGDTIIEVLLALAVLGFVIMGSYSIATKSLNGIRIAQERGEALKIAETQTEIIKQHFDSRDATITDFDTFFARTSSNPYIALNSTWAPYFNEDYGICFKLDTNQPQKINLPQNDREDIHNLQFNNDCKFGDEGRYHVFITTDLNETVFGKGPARTYANFTYRIYVMWERAGGGNLETLNLNYRDSW